jgi:hypothetical protein
MRVVRWRHDNFYRNAATNTSWPCVAWLLSLYGYTVSFFVKRCKHSVFFIEMNPGRSYCWLLHSRHLSPSWVWTLFKLTGKRVALFWACLTAQRLKITERKYPMCLMTLVEPCQASAFPTLSPICSRLYCILVLGSRYLYSNTTCYRCCSTAI